MKNYKKQTGAILLWSLIFLLVLLMLGVTSIRMSGLDTRIAGNEMHRMLTYQAAESSVMRVSDFYYFTKASEAAGHVINKTGMTDQISLGDSPVNINSTAKIELLANSIDCPVMTGLANSIDASKSAGGNDCQLYTVEVNSKLSGSGARSQHSRGTFTFKPVVSGL